MSYTLYQMPSSLWHKNHALFNSDSKVERADYLPVYQGGVPDHLEDSDDMTILEELFEKFNMNHPANYASRSMSAGDVVMIGSGGEESKYYLCCSFGWHQLPSF